MATGAAGGDGLYGGLFEGCISGHDMGVRRRPYHRNCSCELHKSRGICSHLSPSRTVSYPIRRAWSETSLVLMASAHSSPGASPVVGAAEAAEAGVSRRKLVLCNEEDEEAVSCKP